MDDSKIIIIGSNGQLGKALQDKYPNATAVDRTELDISDKAAVNKFAWDKYKTVINAAAYTNVDGAETAEGRVSAWKINAQAVAHLVENCRQHDLTLIHISTDYVFDGTKEMHYEDESFSPLGVYGQSKAAGDIAASLAPKHYIIRTSWVFGDGPNFVRSILGLGKKNMNPNVVADQFGRPTFTAELVRVIDHLLLTDPGYGVYNASNGGDIISWADIARQVYDDAGYSHLKVSNTTAEEYFAGKLSSPRPVHSGLDLSKLQSSKFTPTDWRDDLMKYVKKEMR